MQTTPEIDRVLDRVKKLLTLGNDPAAAEGERDNALRMAVATLAKHNLSIADAESRGQQTNDPRDQFAKEYYCWPWMRSVGFSIAELFLCKFFFSRSRKNYVKYYFIGRTSNIGTSVEMTDYVIKSIQKEAAAHRAKGGDHLSFCKGAAVRITERCREIRAEEERRSAAAAVPGTALVLASVYKTELSANAEYLRDTMKIKLKTSVTRERNARSTDWYAGRAAGDKISLNRQLGGGSNNSKRIGA